MRIKMQLTIVADVTEEDGKYYLDPKHKPECVEAIISAEKSKLTVAETVEPANVDWR